MNASSDLPAGSSSIDADGIEHPRDAAALAQAAVVLREKKAQFAGGTVAIVGRSVDDDGQPVRTVAFVANLLDLALAGLSRSRARSRA